MLIAHYSVRVNALFVRVDTHKEQHLRESRGARGMRVGGVVIEVYSRQRKIGVRCPVHVGLLKCGYA